MSNNEFKMPTFSIDTVDKVPGIKRMFDIALAIKDSIMQWGGPGIGKSQSVQQWNAKKVIEYNKRIAAGENVLPWNPDVCDIRLSMKEPVDMIGVPMPFKDENGDTTTVWAIPSVWPREGKFSGGVIHLDEMNQGQAAILNAAFQLIQDRQLGDYKVPDGYLIIASSNPSAFNNTVTELSVPLSNRFSHFNIAPNFESWLNYRMNNNGNLEVMTFLKTQGENMLYDQDTMKARIGSDATELYTDLVITPRSWEVVERVLSLPEGTEETGGFTIEEKQRYCTGRLGLALTAKFFNYIKEKSKYQDWHEILVDGKEFKSEELNVFWAVQMACMAAMIHEEDDDKCRSYVLNFLKATRALTNKQNKVINMAALARTPRIISNNKVFKPLEDCPDLLSLATQALKS